MTAIRVFSFTSSMSIYTAIVPKSFLYTEVTQPKISARFTFEKKIEFKKIIVSSVSQNICDQVYNSTFSCDGVIKIETGSNAK